MTDAFRQASALAPVIAGAVNGSDAELDAAVARWARWRDRDAFEHHWLSCDLGAPGNQPRLLSAMMGAFEARGRFGEFVDIFEHRAMPSKVVTPPRLLAAAAGMAARGGSDRRRAWGELRDLVVNDMRRRRLWRHPVYVDPGLHADAGETEVPEPVAA